MPIISAFSMHTLILKNLPHILCGFIILARLGDIGSTFLATPTLMHEANPLARKFGLGFNLVLSLLLCFIPYISVGYGIMVLVPSLLVSASNTAKVWFMRTYGEQAYYDLLLRLARRSRLSHVMAGTIVSALFMALAGLVLLFLYPRPDRDWGYWFAVGILLYAFAVGFYGSLFNIRVFKAATRVVTPEDHQPPPA